MKKTIAVVEDSEDNRMLVRQFLEDHYEIVEYDSGPAAIAGLPAAGADLVLLDISLPGMDGIEVLGHLRQHESLRQLRVIALTAHAMTGDRERFTQAGFDDYVSKPIIDVGVLIAAIERWIAPAEPRFRPS